jgi:hemerythrin-like domain-containing protein
MNLWKPLALVSTSALVMLVGYQAASANGAHHQEPSSVGFPHMEAAIARLREARHELDNAEHNKGGWRDRAIESTDRAIAESKRGIEWAGDR